MPRNASGTYSLPSGNPVSSGTLIDATWANNTLNDIANEMTDSLSRSGEGGMLAPFRLNDGVQATPGLAFTNEPSTGMYRAGTNEAWLVAGGTQVLQVTNNGAAARFAAGAVGTPSLTFFGDLNTGLWSPAADTIAASTGGSERMRLDSSGNLGLGVTPSASWFASSKAMQIGIAGAPYMGLVQQTTTTCDGYMLWGARLSGDRAFQYTTTGDAVCAYRQNAGTHNWFTAASGTAGNTISFTQAMTLDASGNLGIGTASPGEKLDVVGNCKISSGRLLVQTQASGSPATPNTIELGGNGSGSGDQPSVIVKANTGTTAANTGYLTMTRSRGTTDNATTIVAADDRLGMIRFSGANGTGFDRAAEIYAEVDGTPGASNDMPGRIVFATTADGSATPTERMRITGAGNIVAGASAALATTATNGFLYVPTCAGTPTGTPTAITGMAPIVVNTTNNKLYFYSGGVWRDAGP